MKKLILVTILIFTTSHVFASCSATQCTSTVKLIYPSATSDGRVFVQLDDSMTALNCTPFENVYYTLHESHKRFDEIYQGLSLAYALGKQVRLRIYENTSDCSIAYLMLL